MVRDVAVAERASFDFAVISDHYFPWLEAQGRSPYACSVLGAAGQAPTAAPGGQTASGHRHPQRPGDARPEPRAERHRRLKLSSAPDAPAVVVAATGVVGWQHACQEPGSLTR